MRYRYKTQNTCCKYIEFDINENIISNIEFLGGGCPGNLQALKRLVDGMSVEEIENKLSGITCGTKTTSCPDQLSKAVIEAFKNQK